MVVKTKKITKKITKKVESKPSLIQKNKKILAAIALTTLAGISTGGYKLYKIKKRSKVLGDYARNLRNIIENKNKFLACDTNIKALGNKSNFDTLPFEIIDEILKKFTVMADINKQCLVNGRIKEYCCNNRQRIFIEIFKYLGYIKGINKVNAEFLFTFLEPKEYFTKINEFYIHEINHHDIGILSIFIIIVLNNKLNLSDIDHTKNKMYWGLYPAIYYYTKNTVIKNYILHEFNTLNINNIVNDNIDYFIALNGKMANYIINNILNKLGLLTDNDIYKYSQVYINIYKNRYPRI